MTSLGDPKTLRSDLRQLDELLSEHLHRLRMRGRTTLGDAVGGALIETGEAETLLYELEQAHLDDDDEESFEVSSRWATPALERARKIYDLADFDLGALVLALAVEVDSRYGRLVAYLNDHAAKNRPTVGLAAALFASDRLTAMRHFEPDAPLRRFRLIEIDGSLALPDAPLRIPDTVRQRLIGVDRPPTSLRPCVQSPLASLELPSTVVSSLEALAPILANGNTTVVVSGQPGSGRDAIAAALPHLAGRGAMVLEAAAVTDDDAARRLERDARWYNAVPVICATNETDIARLATTLAGLATSSVVTTTQRGFAVAARATRGALHELRVPTLDVERRASIWDRQLPEERRGEELDLDELATRFHFGPEMIVSASRAALEAADVEGVLLSKERLESMCRRLPRAQLTQLADRLRCPYQLDDLIVPADTVGELELAISWSRHASTLFGQSGAGARLHAPPGLACLFAGPPGTGKTMAAQILARAIGLDLFRVDLSRVVSKYIGETEKNLAALFDEAAEANAILFFDEADALFGKRTEVKDAHDRYANVETGFLLQRMENHRGISILATNLRKNLDDAFLRRLQVIADFPRPGVEERARIWNRHLPELTPACDINVDLLAQRFEVTGGEIRNAVMTAHLLSADEDTALAMRHVVLGLWREMGKAGRILDPDRFGPWRDLVLGANANGHTSLSS